MKSVKIKVPDVATLIEGAEVISDLSSYEMLTRKFEPLHVEKNPSIFLSWRLQKKFALHGDF
jgi:hypothetical protein